MPDVYIEIGDQLFLLFPTLPAQATLPDDDRAPAQSAQLSNHAIVSRTVGVHFRLPEIRPGLRQAVQWTRMAMPEAPVHEHHSAMLGKHQIRPSRQSGAPEPEAKAARVQAMPDGQFDLGIAATHPRHLRGAGRGRKRIQVRQPCDVRASAGVPPGLQDRAT